MDFTDSVTVNVDPDVLFAYIGNVEKLPRYVPHVIDAQRLEGEAVRVSAKDPGGSGPGTLVKDAWLRLLPSRHVEWGVGSAGDYRGEASVIPTDAGSILMVSLHLEHADYSAVNRELKAALQTIKQVVEGGRRS
jgi:hypothetical protein